MGAQKSAYELLSAKDSFIHIDDFESPKEIANYLISLNEDNYANYLRAIRRGSFEVPISAMCRLCDAANLFAIGGNIVQR